MTDLSINCQEEKIVKSVLKSKAKKSKAKKSKKKDSFINDSSESDFLSEEEYIPVKTRGSCRRMPKIDKITPVKKSVYYGLYENNSKCTRKKNSI